MDMRKWVQDQIAAERKKPIPVLSFPVISLMGITVEQLIASSYLQAEGMKQIAKRADPGAVLSMMDLSVEAEAFGAQVRYADDEVPSVVGTLVKCEEDADALVVPAMGAGRTGRYVEAVGQAVQQITDRPVLGGIIGPFSLAGRLLDVSTAMMKCIRQPAMVHTVLEKVTGFLVDYAKAYKAAGAHGVVMAEPLAGLLSPKLAEKFSEQYVKRIVDAVQDDSFIVVYHNCGNTVLDIMDSIIRTGCAAYHFGNAVDMKKALEKMPEDVLVMGNIDPARQFRNGTPESVYMETQKLMVECAQHKNFIISSGCDIPPATSWKNIDAFFAAVDNYYHMESIFKSLVAIGNPGALLMNSVASYTQGEAAPVQTAKGA